MRKELKDFLSEIPSTWRTRSIKKHPKYLQFLNELYPSYKLRTQVYLFLRDYEHEPKCVVCQGLLNKITAETCSPECREKLRKNRGVGSISKMRRSLQTKHGVDNPSKLQQSQEKRKQSLITKYGIAASPKNVQRLKDNREIYKEKQLKTLQNRYGVLNPGQIEGHGQKVKNTLKERYGASHWTEIPELIKNRENKAFSTYSELSKSVKILEIQKADSTLQNAFDNPNPRISFYCYNCEEKENIPTETYKWRIRKAGTPCSTCAGINSNTSLQETEIYEYVRGIYNGTIVRNTRTVIHPLELDVYLPDLKVAVEYCGLYWHREAKVGKDYHARKLQLCQEQGIRLITVFEDEWLYKNAIVKNRLQYIINNNRRSVGARKCTIAEISTQTARNFCEEYHIQGYVNASVKLGLFYGETLLSLMTFSKPNRAKGGRSSSNDFELSRFCCSPEYTIPGGASKLFKYFIRHWQPKKIISYSDRRWNTGVVYQRIGMDFVHNTPLNYWYIDGDKRIYRYKLRKQPTDPKDKTERELRTQQGWNRIWDCGNAKYEWKSTVS